MTELTIALDRKRSNRIASVETVCDGEKWLNSYSKFRLDTKEAAQQLQEDTHVSQGGAKHTFGLPAWF